jgi:hypothetical protein
MYPTLTVDTVYGLRRTMRHGAPLQAGTASAS